MVKIESEATLYSISNASAVFANKLNPKSNVLDVNLEDNPYLPE